MPKNIVVFSDGTGQEGGIKNDTNVYKLFNMVLDRSPEQIVFYDRGLGTDRWRLSGLVGGRGISKNVQECYRFIFENYEAGDRIYLFGFSRGAATVRSLSGFIHHFGILPKSRAELIKRAWKIYRSGNEKKVVRRAKAFTDRHHNQWCKIKFLGVWDTVLALGLPFRTLDTVVNWIPCWKHNFHNVRLCESVDCGIHALALDDERKTFRPTYWNEKSRDDQIMEQVWFCGAHSDVGGGCDSSGLSDITLGWMIAKARKQGLMIYPKHEVRTNPRPDGTLHDPREGWGELWRHKTRSWDADRFGTPVVHASVLERTKNRENFSTPEYSSWIFEQDYDTEPWGDERESVEAFTE